MSGIDKQKTGNRADKERARFKRYKEDVAKEGKPFFPHAVFHDTIMALLVVGVIIGLTAIWKWTVPGHHNGTSPGWLGPLFDEKADAGTTSFIPRPDWYFYFLFYLLRIFKWPDTVVLGTVIVPNILLVILIGLPFYDKRMERRPSRRPVAMIAFVLTIASMGLLTYKGATAKEELASEAVGNVPRWAQVNSLYGDGVAGARLFAASACLNCHIYLGNGNANAGAPELSAFGAKGVSSDFLAQYIANPRAFGNSVMPVFGGPNGLSPAQLKQLGVFVYQSQGGKKAPPEKAPAPVQGDATAGKKVFLSQPCGGCHTLKDAGTKGAVGPNLDGLKPNANRVKTIVTNGSANKVMPSFKGTLTEQQINDVAVYVSSVAGK